MDHPDFAAIYADEYNRIRSLANTESVSSAGMQPAVTMAARNATERAPVDLSFSQFSLGLLQLAWLAITWPLRALWNGVVWTLLEELWTLIRTLLYISLPLLAIFTFLQLIWSTSWLQRLCGRLRERYDDFALNNQIILALEHAYANFKRNLYARWHRIRYNERGDAFVRFLHRLYFLPDTVQRLVFRNLGKIVLCVVAVLLVVRFSRSNALTEQQRLQDDRLRLVIAERKIPNWVLSPDGYYGSNSHYESIPDDKWPAVLPLGSDETSSAVPPSRTKPAPTTASEQEYRSTSTRDTAEKATDFWAPPKGGKTILRQGDIKWCRECQQYHGGELPY